MKEIFVPDSLVTLKQKKLPHFIEAALLDLKQGFDTIPNKFGIT